MRRRDFTTGLLALGCSGGRSVELPDGATPKSSPSDAAHEDATPDGATPMTFAPPSLRGVNRTDGVFTLTEWGVDKHYRSASQTLTFEWMAVAFRLLSGTSLRYLLSHSDDADGGMYISLFNNSGTVRARFNAYDGAGALKQTSSSANTNVSVSSSTVHVAVGSYIPGGKLRICLDRGTIVESASTATGFTAATVSAAIGANRNGGSVCSGCEILDVAMGDTGFADQAAFNTYYDAVKLARGLTASPSGLSSVWPGRQHEKGHRIAWKPTTKGFADFDFIEAGSTTSQIHRNGVRLDTLSLGW